jgi:hypothetical protein
MLFLIILVSLLCIPQATLIIVEICGKSKPLNNSMPEGEREGILQAGQKILKLGVFRIQPGRAAGVKK